VKIDFQLLARHLTRLLTRHRKFITAVIFFSSTFFLMFLTPFFSSAAEEVSANIDMLDVVVDVVAVVPANFPPHYSLDEEGNTRGFAIDVLNEVAKIAKLNVSYLVKDTWKEVDKALRNPRPI